MLKERFYQENKIIKSLIIALSATILLTGCGIIDNDDNVNAYEEVSVDLSSYPTGVQDGTVSPTYYSDLYSMLTTYLKYAEKMTSQGISLDSIKYESERYLVELAQLDLMPVTDADSNLDSLALDFKIQSKLVAEYMLDYYSSEHIRDRNNANGAMRESVKAFNILNEMMIDYKVES